MDNELFWERVARRFVTWIKPWSTLTQGSFSDGSVQWFCDGKLNVSVNCLDRHLTTHANKTALIWQGDELHAHQSYTFQALYHEVCQMANALKFLAINKGDCVGIYLPLIPEAVIAMLACARIGAVHVVVFAGFSAEALRQRLESSQAKCLLTADGYQRGGKNIGLKELADKAVTSLGLSVLVIKHNNEPVNFNLSTDYWWHELQPQMSNHCDPEIMDAEDPLFILYTSGSTGAPKGLVHSTGGYLVQVAYSFDYIFSGQDADVFWCTADVGWITGHSYTVYGSLCNGITTLIFGGIPTWPTPDRYWQTIDNYKVTILYTAPTAIRALKATNPKWLETSSRNSLRLLGSVGEPINPEVWQWYFKQVGKSVCPIVDTWWQTETGAIMLCPQNTTLTKPGSAGQPLPEIKPVLLDNHYQVIEGAAEGLLAFAAPWPSLARTISQDHQRYQTTYFKNNYYLTGDAAYRDIEGDYWIQGRIDDVINVSGHRLGTAEIESALLCHQAVSEAAVVAIPHSIKGEGICAFVTLKTNPYLTENLKSELIELVKEKIGSIAKPDEIRIAMDLPKTRSGKILRRILKKIASGKQIKIEELGDLSTLSNPSAIEDLLDY